MRRVWSEHVPFEELRRPRLLRLLADRSVQLIVALQPAEVDRELEPLLAACNDAGVDLALWPLLNDSAGRWPGDTNVTVFAGHLRRVLDCVEAVERASRPRRREIIFDLEPPIVLTRSALALRFWDGRVRLRPADLDVAARRFSDLVAEVRRRDFLPVAVVAPMVLCDPDQRRGGWQRLLGTPVDGVGFERIVVMAYTSLFEGYTQGLLSRRDALALLRLLCERTHRRWPRRGSVALGVTGGGALGDEKPYRGRAELGDDTAVAQAAGIDDLALFGLTGLLDRADPPERWLETFVTTPPALSLPRITPRATAVFKSAEVAGRAFALFCRSFPVETRRV